MYYLFATLDMSEDTLSIIDFKSWLSRQALKTAEHCQITQMLYELYCTRFFIITR